MLYFDNSKNKQPMHSLWSAMSHTPCFRDSILDLIPPL